jgi:hypothetical protein
MKTNRWHLLIPPKQDPQVATRHVVEFVLDAVRVGARS